MARLVTTPEQVTAEWLTDTLRENGLLDSAHVSSVEWQRIGTGKLGDNARFMIHYSEAVDAPATLVGKFPAIDESTRTTAGGMGAYRSEVNFYRQLAPQCAGRIPKTYATEIDDTGLEFVILMQDLSPAEPGNQLIGETEQRARQAVTEAARLHASFHGSESALSLDFVLQDSEDSAAFGQSLLEQNWPGFLQRFGDGLSQPCIDLGNRYVENHTNWCLRYQGTKTLVHTDFRSENLLFDRGGNVTAVDWQGVKAGCGLIDVSYFMGGSLDTELRRSCEQNIVEHYRKTLEDLGVSLSSNACWELYRQFAVHGIMITVLGAMFSDADDRGDKMFLTMAQRHLQHCVDLESAEFFS